VFIGATNDSRFRGFDKDSGKELWVTRLPASAHAAPMTFRGRKSGRQFIVIAAGGGNKYNKTYSDSLIAFALPTGSAEAEPLITYAKPSSYEAAPRPRPTTASAGPEIFSHQRHAALKLACTECHQTATTGERAGLPQGSVCVKCHQSMPAMEFTAQIYRLPDFIFFRHSQHAAKGIGCATCHGDVWKEDRVRPVLQMKMAACVDCHKANQATVACTACHELSR
jgi:predicted CXXCH cytochrome family protein